MHALPTDLVSLACKIFLGLAYPAGADTIPAHLRGYLELPEGANLADPETQAKLPRGTFQPIRDEDGQDRGLAFRLGCGHYPYLKCRVQEVNHSSGPLWVFAVDTHDWFFRDSPRPPADHPDAERWLQLQRANAELKQLIERAWDGSGVLTFPGLLRLGINTPAAS